MKKIFLSAVLAASSWVVFAQNTNTTDNTNTTNSSNTNTTATQQTNTSTDQNNTNLNSNTNLNNTNNANLNNSTDLNTTNSNLNNGTNMNSTSSNQMNNTTSTSNYNAYGIPNYVQMNFQAQYPNVSNLTWDQSTADWYHGYYSDPTTGRYTHVYYSTDPYYNVQYYPERVTGYTVALPVLETWVPDEVVTAALNQYKQNLYDISAMKGNNAQDIYVVRIRDNSNNGELKSMYMDASGTAVTDYLRTEEQINMGNTTNINSSISTDTNSAMDNSSMNNSDATNMNGAKVKTKTKMADGSEIKTKTKDGKTKTKVSGSTTTNTDNNQL